MPNSKIVGPGFRPIGAPKMTFHEIGPAAEHVRFFPWKKPPTPTRDAAPGAPSTIGGVHAQQHVSIEKVVALMGDIAMRISALESKRSAQRQLVEQQQQIVQPSPPTATQDHAPCSCQQPAPRQAPYRDGVKPMDRNPALAPNRNITFGAFPNPRLPTRDQENFCEKPSRFTSQEADRMASHIVGAGPPSAKEMNDAARAYWSRDAKQQLNTSGGHGVEASSSDPSERFVGAHAFSQFAGDAVRPSPGALSAMHAAYAKARTPQARDSVESAWRDYMSNTPRDAASAASQWKPKQPLPPAQAPKASTTEDAPWSSLYEANKGTIGSSPDVIKPGQQLSMPGGGTHTVAAGETLSGIAAAAGGGGSSVPVPPVRPAGLGESYGQGQEPGAAASRNEEKMLSLPTESTSGEPTPTPPSRRSDLGGGGGGADVPTPPTRPEGLGEGSYAQGQEPGSAASRNVEKMLSEPD